MLIPHRSAFDPEIQGEGSIDALGLAPFADRLTEREIPRDDRAHVAPAIYDRDGCYVGHSRAVFRCVAKDCATPAWLISNGITSTLGDKKTVGTQTSELQNRVGELLHLQKSYSS
jgi:hypothetical protein